MATDTHVCNMNATRDGITATIFDSGTMETGVHVSCKYCDFGQDLLIIVDDGWILDNWGTADGDWDDHECADCARYDYAIECAFETVYDHECA